MGDKAPEFKLASTSGRMVSLSDYKDKAVILYFYPKDFTPGCTQEACDFRDGHAALKKKGAIVLGVSPDPVEKHQEFVKEYQLPFELLSDPDHTAAKNFGVYGQKTLYGRTFMGVQRSTFCIDPEGKVKAVFPKVKVDGHVQEVLDCL
ncbi:MAG: thioredoxin-dependent thiol peroxidase [Candidatus Omnitrophica bacterium]|nr:thioredoxin-dependent thiol peroxidase [Candidatus Omnitrophota bacterium]